MPRTRSPYPSEFRREAIRLVRASDEEHPIPKVATELGVTAETLSNWVKQDDIDAGERQGLATEDREELRRLRREVKVLRQEKEILRKAAVGSTGQCNTLGFRCCLNRRCGSGEAGSSWRVVGGWQEGAVEAVEGRGVHLPHRPGTTKAFRLHPRDARGHRRDLSARAASAQMRAHPLRAGGDLPGTRCRRIPSYDRRSAGPRCASTVCREVNRNGGCRNYRAQKAHERAWERARPPNRCLLATNHFLRDVLARKLYEDCSPEQISGWLKREYPED